MRDRKPRLFAQNTKVPVVQTRAEIERLLGRHKAAQFGTAVDYQILKARVQFRLHDRIVRFVIDLPDPKKYGRAERLEQQERQKWRALLLVIKAKLEAVENAIASFEEEFLGYIVMPNDQTMAELAKPLIAGAYSTGRLPSQLLLTDGDTR
jgi:hypothetical protein